MVTSCTDSDHPYYNELIGKTGKQKYDFFMEENAKRMKFVSLGEAFDFLSFGGLNFVAYGNNDKELTEFTKTWIEKQEPKIKLDRIKSGKGSYTIKERSREYSYLWNKFNHSGETPELPRINYEKCNLGRDHTKMILDRGGRLRCAHQEVFEIKPSFTEKIIEEDIRIGIKKYKYNQSAPETPRYYNEELEVWMIEGCKKYELEKNKFDEEEPVIVVDTCYSIIKEPKDFYLPLEKILNRLNCSNRENQTIHPFSGLTLADFVKAWWEQSGEKQYFKKEGDIEFYKAFPDFVPMSSD